MEPGTEEQGWKKKFNGTNRLSTHHVPSPATGTKMSYHARQSLGHPKIKGILGRKEDLC